MPYTAVKSKGTPINERILAADKYIAVGHLSPLNSMIPKARQAELKKRFDKVMSLKQYDINNV